MQGDRRLLQVVLIAIAGTDLIECGIHFRRAQFRTVRADQQMAGKPTFRKIAYDIAIVIKLFDAFAETGAARVTAGQTERHVRAQRGRDFLQAFDRPIEIPQRVQCQNRRRRIGGTAGHARADGDALVDVQRHVRLMAARFGHGEQCQHGVVAAHIAAGRGQVARYAPSRFSEKPLPGALRVAVTVSYTPTAQ